MATKALVKRKPGRPPGGGSVFSPELAEKILAELPYCDGGLEEICKRPGMPSDRVVYKWLTRFDADPSFIQAYARARSIRADVMFQRALTDALNADDPIKGRLVYDARKWVASKLKPSAYGEKITQELTGVDGGPIETRTQISVLLDVRSVLEKAEAIDAEIKAIAADK